MVWVLLAFAGLRAAQGQPRTALRLASAGMALGDELKMHLLAREKDTVERWLAPAREALSESEAEDARKAGQQLTVDEAIQLALAAEDPVT